MRDAIDITDIALVLNPTAESVTISSIVGMAAHLAAVYPSDPQYQTIAIHLGRGAGAKSTSLVSGPHAAPTKIKAAPITTRTSTV